MKKDASLLKALISAAKFLKPHKIRKVYCLHCGKEISYHKYKYQGALCDRCAECSCVA